MKKSLWRPNAGDDFELHLSEVDTASASIEHNILGGYNIEAIARGTITAGTITISGKQFEADTAAEIGSISSVDTALNITTSSDDNFIVFETSSDYEGSVEVVVFLKKKDSAPVSFADYAEFADSPLYNGGYDGQTICLTEAVTGQGGSPVQLKWCESESEWRVVGDFVLYSSEGLTIDTTGQNWSWIQIDTIDIPCLLLQKNLKASILLNYSTTTSGVKGFRIGGDSSEILYSSIPTSTYYRELDYTTIILDNKTTIAKDSAPTSFSSIISTTQFQAGGVVTVPIGIFDAIEETNTIIKLEIRA